MPEVKLSNPDKVLFPDDGITKADLAEHYARVAELMVPHCKDRPMNLWRWNKGIAEDVVVQQSLPKGAPDWVARCEVPRRKGGDIVHGMINDADTLRWLAQQNCITPHIWNARCDIRDKPDRIVFDLDPDRRRLQPGARRRARHRRGAARPRARAVREGHRLARHPHRRAAAADPHRRRGARDRGRARRADRRRAAGHADHVLAQGQARRQDPGRRRPQHLRADDRRPVRGPGAPGRSGGDAGGLGRGRRRLAEPAASSSSRSSRSGSRAATPGPR